MVECLVEYEYVAQEEDELTIRPGDVISNVLKQDGGWWEGEINGRKGVFPDNFVKETKQEVKKAAPESNHRASVKKVSGPGGGHVAELANRLGKEGAIRIGPPAPGSIKRESSTQGKRQQRVKVTFSYSPENDDELRLEVGEVVTVTKQEEEGWWEGVLNGKTGMFPSNFVEPLDEEGGGGGGNEASGDEVNTPEIEIHGKKIKGVGLGNIFSAGPIKLRSTGSKDHPSAVKRAPTSPKAPVPKEPAPQENEKRDSLKRSTVPTEPPPSLPPKDQPTVKPFVNNCGYAVPYEKLDEDPEASESSNGRGYSPGGIVVEDGVMIKAKNCASPFSSESSSPVVDIASPESSCSLELGKTGVLSSSSFSSSGPGSSRSENASDDVPYELSALSQTRHTPPPRFTQFNFRKRRSRGTPKNSPKLNLLAISEVNQNTQQNEKPPKKVAKLVGTTYSIQNRVVMTDDCIVSEMKTAESQTEAEYVENETVKEVTPQNVVIKAFVRSSSEPCLRTARKSVSFVTRDNYISDGEEEEKAIQISESAKKRMSRGKRRFTSKSLIDSSKITDSLKLLRLRLGIDPESAHTEGEGMISEWNNQVEIKAMAKTLSTIKNKFIRKIASSPVRGDKIKDTKVTALSNVNIGDTGIPVTEDNCSTTALRGSPLSTRSSSVLEVDEAGTRKEGAPFPIVSAALSDDDSKENKDPTVKAKSSQSTPPVYKLPFFTFTLGRKKSQKVKIQEPKDGDETSKEPDKIEDGNQKRPVPLPETSYFQALDTQGKLPPAIMNIGTKYKLFSKRQGAVTPDKAVRGNGNDSEDLALSRKDSDLFLTTFQDVLATNNESHNVVGEKILDEGVRMAIPYKEPEFASVGGFYAPNEGDQNKPLIKRTQKSTNIAIDKDAAVEPRKPNAKKSSAQKNKAIKKSNSITQRLRRIWHSRDKTSKDSDEELDMPEDVAQATQNRRAKLTTTSDTIALQKPVGKELQVQKQTMTTKSEGSLVHPASSESAMSDEDDNVQLSGYKSPKNINQNCDHVPMDAIFRLQNFVHSFTQSETDVSLEACNEERAGNSVPQIKRIEMSEKECEPRSSSSGNAIAEPCLQSEDANMEYPVPVGNKENRWMDVEKSRKKLEKEPRRICPTRISVQPESMQTENIELQTEVRSSEPETKSPVNGVVMRCQIEQNREVFRPYGGFLDSIYISEKQEKDNLADLFKEPGFLGKRNKVDPMDMDICEYLDTRKINNAKNMENTTRNVKWSRWNSAPPGSLDQNIAKRSSFPRSNTSLDAPYDSSLDKWDMMKIILEETETVSTEGIQSEKPTLLTIRENVRRPFDYDESFSTGSSCGTDSADETTGMETGDVEPENNINSDSSSHGSIDPVIRSFYASDDDLYGIAPASSPCDQRYQLQRGISISSLNDSLSQLEAAGDRGGSGEKRKKCEVGTPTKDENHGRKVRLESPESDEEGPPRARRVLRSAKLGNKILTWS